MAGETHLILRGCRPQLVRVESAMRVVAIAARNQTLVDLVMKGLGKVGFRFQMAGETQRRLCRSEQLVFDLGCVDRMAVNATNIVFQMLRTQKVGVLFAEFVTSKATPGRLFPRQLPEVDDFGDIAGFRMLLAGTVAGFAALPRRALVLVGLRLPVRPLVEALELL